MQELFGVSFGLVLFVFIIWLALLPLIALCYCWRYTRRTAINTEKLIELLKSGPYLDFVRSRLSGEQQGEKNEDT